MSTLRHRGAPARRVESPPLSPSTVNPFISSEVGKSWSAYEILKTLLMTLLLVPLIRMLLLLVILCLGYICAWIITIGVDLDSGKPINPTRQTMLSFVLKLVAHGGLFCAGFYSVEWRGSVDSRAKVIVVNHTNMFDGFFPVAQVVPTIVAMSPMKSVPVLGTILKAMQTIFVDRVGTRDKKQVVLDKMLDRTSCPGWPPIMIFPEGTTTNGTALITFKRGAFVLGVPVQPVVLNYKKNKCLDLSWVPKGPSSLVLFYRMLCQFRNYASVDFLPLYKPDAAELLDPAFFADNVRAVMAKRLDAEVTAHSLEDSFMRVWMEENCKSASPNLIFGELKSKYKISSVKEVRKIAKSFGEFDLKYRFYDIVD